LNYDRHATAGLQLDDQTCDALGAVGREIGVEAPW
jgi:hypothetical protein